MNDATKQMIEAVAAWARANDEDEVLEDCRLAAQGDRNALGYVRLDAQRLGICEVDIG